jgi:hypothetical protein
MWHSLAVQAVVVEIPVVEQMVVAFWITPGSVICMPAIFSSWRGGTFIGKLEVVGGVVHIYIYIYI